MRQLLYSAKSLLNHAPLFLLTALVAAPVFSTTAPTVGDGLNHFYRLAALHWHVSHGDYYPRLFSDLHYGFGAPVLNFYAPLSYFAALPFAMLGMGLGAAMQLGYGMAMVLAVLGAHGWARATFGSSAAALLVAAAYGLSPYMYLDAFHRGAYPELWGLALAPFVFWAAHHLAVRPSLRAMALAALAHAALILTHALTALMVAPVLAAYMLLLAPQARTAARWLAGVCLAAALGAFFALPVALESQFIQLYRTVLPADFDYRRNFLNVGQLYALPFRFDPQLVFNEVPPGLALALAMCAALAVWLAWRQKHPRRFQATALFALAAALSMLTLSISEPLWSVLPLAQFVQFPWRFVGLATLFFALASGGLPAALSGMASANRRLPDVALATVVAVLFFSSLSWTFHAAFSSLPDRPQPNEVIDYEVDWGQIGTTSAGEYLPRWVRELPPANTLDSAYHANAVPLRLAPLPEGVALGEWQASLTEQKFSYSAPSGFIADFNIFYFPGWAATLDGEPHTLAVQHPHGTMRLQLPGGAHTVRLYRQPTAPQLMGGIVSVLAAGMVVAFMLLRPPPPSRQHVQPQPHIAPVVSLVLLALIASRWLYFDRLPNPFNNTALGSLPNPVAANFDRQLELIGYEFPHDTSAASGEPLSVVLYWRALSPLDNDYATTVQLADAHGNRFGASDSQHPGRVPTSRWLPDQYARDSHRVLSLVGTPPGTYRLLVGVYGASPLSYLQDGAPAGIEYELGTVTITRAAAPVEGELGLVSFELASDEVMVGDALLFTTLWHSGDAPANGLTARLALTDANNQTLFARHFPPAGAGYPSAEWSANELIRYPHAITLPPDLPAGVARLSIALIDPDGEIVVPPVLVGDITIGVPPRTYAIPSIPVRVDHDFGDAIRLLGFEVGGGQTTLYWQSLALVDQRLTVFVHNLDEHGQLVAGHDAPPHRATTGWLVGEVIADAHPLVAGSYFEVGLYNAQTGERFGEPFIFRR